MCNSRGQQIILNLRNNKKYIGIVHIRLINNII